MKEEKTTQVVSNQYIDDTQYTALIRALCREYTTAWYVNAETKEAQLIRNNPPMTKDMQRTVHANSGNYDELMTWFIDSFAVARDREQMHRELSLDHLLQHVTADEVYQVNFALVGLDGRDHHMQVCIARDGESIEGSKFICGFRDMDASVREQIKRQQELEEQREELAYANTVIRGLSLEYYTIWTVDKDTTEMHLVRNASTKEVIQESVDAVLQYKYWDEPAVEYANNYVVPEDRDHMLKNVLAAEVMKHLEKEDRYELNFRQLNDAGEVTHQQMVFVNADSEDGKRQFVCALRNISNAIKYTPDGGDVTIRFEELESDKKGYAAMRFVVADTGLGMSEEYQKKMFEQFERERTSTVSGIQGTGLGLSIVKKLVDMMGGTISVKSKQGEGTTMTIDLSLRIGKDPHKTVSAEQEMDYSMFDGKRILLAEDIDVNAMIAEEILKSNNFLVERVSDGQEALDKMIEMDADYYDLILMDIQMPNMDGYTSTREIRKLADPVKSRIPIIAMTANAFAEDRAKALEAGMNAHVGKPIDMVQLFSTLRDVIVYKGFYVDSVELNSFRNRYKEQGLRSGYLIYKANREEKIVFADAVLAEIYGCETAEEFIAYVDNSFHNMIHPDDLARIQKDIADQQSESENSIDNIEFRIIRKDGAVRTVRDIGHKAFDGNDYVYYVYMVDVTDVNDSEYSI